MSHQHDDRMDFKTEILNLRLGLLNLTERVKAREVEVEKTLREVSRVAYAMRDAVAEMKENVGVVKATVKMNGKPGPKKYDALAELGL